MGIYIHLALAPSITPEEWKPVYEESLILAKALPLAEYGEAEIDGIPIICLTKTGERETSPRGENTLGWSATGDYESMKYAENYYLSRKFIAEEIEYCEDVMFEMLPHLLEYYDDDERFHFVYRIWNNKTQGRPYHMYLLAIACMIEFRLKKKAMVYGDITRGQCLEAVKIANEILDEPISAPDSCYPDKLIERVRAMPLTEDEKIEAFEYYYLGNKDAAFGEQIRKYFTRKVCNKYWEKRFGKFHFGQIGFEDSIHDYLLLGFELSGLFKYASLCRDDNIPQYEDFIKRIMDAKLHLKEKDCSDPLRIDYNEVALYGIGAQFTHVFYGGLKNKKIDRFIPINEIRAVINNELGDKCDVNRIIDEYLKNEAEQQRIDISDFSTEEEYIKACEKDPSEVFRQYIYQQSDKIQRTRDMYDVAVYEDLIFYKLGDKIEPAIAKALRKMFGFYQKLIDEHDYEKLMKENSRVRCKFLAAANENLIIRDKDWKKIFKEIQENEEAFERYYPMVRIDTTNDSINSMVKAIVVNDDLYAFCSK